MRCLVLLAVLLLSAVAHAQPDAGCIDDGKPFDRDALRAGIAQYAAKELGGRVPGSAGDVAARGLIEARLRCLGLAPAFGRDYAQPFTGANGKPTANLVGSIAGDTDEIILVTAHHDHLGDGHLGANDNASGVVALLAIAQAIQQRGTAPHRTIAFAVFGDEEDGMIGSSFYAAHAPRELPLTRVVQVINLDMVGSYASKGFVAAMGTGKRLAGRIVLDELTPKFPKLHVGVGGKARGSDFEPFCQQGIPYVFFWTPDARCYHARCDTVDRIDLGHMAQITELAALLTERLAASHLDLTELRSRHGCFGS